MDIRYIDDDIETNLDLFRYNENKFILNVSTAIEGPLTQADFIGDNSLQLYSFSKDGILQSIRFDKTESEPQYNENPLLSPAKVFFFI